MNIDANALKCLGIFDRVIEGANSSDISCPILCGVY